MSPHVDIAVLSASPAGLSCAIAARLAGLSVCLIERGAGPPDGPVETVLPAGAPIFRELGILKQTRHRCRRRETGIWHSEDGACAVFESFGTEKRRDNYELCLARSNLNAIMLERAIELGADLHFGCRVGPIQANRNSLKLAVDGRVLKPDWLVDASGRRNTTSRQQSLIRTTMRSRGNLLRVRRKRGESGEAHRPASRHSGRAQGIESGTLLARSSTSDRILRLTGLDCATAPVLQAGLLRALMSGIHAAHAIAASMTGAVCPAEAARLHQAWMRGWSSRDRRPAEA